VARPRKDGADPRAINRRPLTELYVKKVRPEASAFNVWDLKERGLVLRVQPSGRRAFKFVYSRGRRKRWYHLGPIGLADARKRRSGRRSAAQARSPISPPATSNCTRESETNRGARLTRW